MDILYNYFTNKIMNNKQNKMPEFLISDEILKMLNKINVTDYLPDNVGIYSGNNARNKLNKQIAFIIEFLFKYFELCLILLFRNKENKFYKYLSIEENPLFKYFIFYKILTTDKNLDNKNNKEILALIYYQILINSKIITNNSIINKNQIVELTTEHINKYKLKGDENFDLSIKQFDNQINLYNYNKIVIYCLDDENKKYYYQDIIDLNRLSINDNSYKIRVNNDIYLIPLQNIETYLYSIENGTKEYYLENNNNENKVIYKFKEIPKYSWDIGYNGNLLLLLSEKDNQIYNFFEPTNNDKLPEEKYYLDKNIEPINNKNNEIIGFINGTKNYSSFALNKEGDVFNIDTNKSKYKWITEKENIKYPLNIPGVKIVNISANYNECYAIGDDGNLYNIQVNNIEKIFPPENTEKFLQCALGDKYLICLLKDNEGKGVIYVMGRNDEYQCGINEDKNSFKLNIESLTKLDIDDKLDFKYICTFKGFTSAVTSFGKLYIWGLKFKKDKKIIFINSPTLINKNNSIIVDKIFLNYYNLYVIGRALNDGKYITKLFSLEINFSNEKPNLILKAINLLDNDDKNSKIIPIKILIREFRAYCLCIDENKLIEKYINKNEENEIDNKIKISINYQKKLIKEELNLENLQEIYNSNELDKFINIFNSFSNKNIKDFMIAFEGMKIGEIKIIDISYNELITYLQGQIELNDLLLFFHNNENNEGKLLFEYLKLRKSLIEKNIMKFINLNNDLKSEGFISKIIEQNIIFLNDDDRMQYFYSLLFNMIDNYLHYSNIRQKQITINRFKALNFKEKFNDKKISDIHLSETIFGQLFHALGDLTGREFLLEKGQKLFKVNLIEEGAEDAGGPYSEVLSDMCNELQSDYLNLFIKTPNNKNNIGELRDKYILNPNCDFINHKKAYNFIGKLMSLAISSGETLNFNLHPIIWKCLLENHISFEEYETIDKNFFNMIQKLKEGLSKKDKSLIDSYDLNFVIRNSNEKEIELIKHGQNLKVTLDNVKLFIDLAQSKRLSEINDQIKYIKEGLYSAIGKNILQVLNWNQLELIVCGEDIFNLEEFKKNTEYIGCNSKDKIIQWFWEWLKSCKEEDKFKYLKYVSGRSRLPKSEYRHKINVFNNKDKYPVAHTCFSTLDLPKYDSKNILCQRMKFAIENITTINDHSI